MTAAERPTGLFAALGNGRLVAVDAEEGTATLEFEVLPEFCHTGGIAQGGFVTGWLDCAMANAVLARTGEGIWPATLEIKTSFLEAARLGEKVRAEAAIDRMGRSIAFVSARIYDASDEVLAIASSTIRLVALG